MKTISLNGIWKLKGRPEEGNHSDVLELDATVPGEVQLDLSREGILPKDLYMGENILETEKFEDWEWWYTRTFTAPDERENVFLVFEGVDCLAEYYLNDEKIGESENMFIAHEFEIGKFLHDGENTLTVHLKSPVIYMHYEDFPVSTTANEFAPAETVVRKAPHSFGWDIMPRAVTAGLWRDVKIEVRDRIRFSQLFFKTTENSCELYYEIACKWTDFNDLEIEVTGSCGKSTFYAKQPVHIKRKKAFRFPIEIKDPKPWFPYGYGEQNIYDGVARIYSEGNLVHEEAISFGLRSVVLEHSDTTDGKNGKFRFLINGVEIMCKGSNWVPLDAFHSRDAIRYEKALSLVKDIGCNILRCWGGNVYEDHTFYDFCDRNGIMVWQDFSMACRVYPLTEKFKKLITEEATSVVRKLRNHPSIILWSGDNEIDGMLMYYGANPKDNKITREWIPDVVKLNDIGRPYISSSPYVSEAVYEDNSEDFMPERHLWGARDYFKSDFYKNSNAHFVSETGYHGCPSMDSIKKFITPERVWPYFNNPEWILHSSDQKGNDARVMLMHNQVIQLFGEVPTNPDEYVIASQISQAEAKKFFIERIRVGRPLKSGVIWWNLLDGWPQMSDAVVDYYFTKKLAYSYIKRSQAPFTIIASEIKDWNLPIYACNDTLTEECGHFTVKDALTEEIVFEGDFTAEANTSTLIAQIPTYYSEQKMLILEWETHHDKGWNHYLCGYPPISLDMYKKVMEKYGFKE